jgi:hypothetical protein
MVETLLKTVLHALELAIVLIAASAIMKIFNLNGVDLQFIISLALAALAKFVRASDAIPVKDWVNKL